MGPTGTSSWKPSTAAGVPSRVDYPKNRVGYSSLRSLSPVPLRAEVVVLR